MATFWLNDPTALVRSTALFPRPGMTMDEKLNAVTRLVCLMALAGYLATSNYRFALAGALTVAVIVAYHSLARPKIEEALTAQLKESTLANYTQPTKENPMMNVLLPEINGNPRRKPALPHSPETDKAINAKVKEGKDPRLFSSSNDALQFETSMRNFYTTPATTVPDEGFKKFCYAELIASPTAKEGDPVALGRYKARLGGVYT